METNKIIKGDCLEVLKELSDESVDMIMTSPPYWNLRDYGNEVKSKFSDWEGQLGLEPDFNLYISHLIQIFNEIKRVLKKEGTCWVNLGDTYSGSNCGKGDTSDNKVQGLNHKDKYTGQKAGKTSLPDKSLCMLPFRFAIEMVNNGWSLRNDIVWYKRNSMPSSVRDRLCNKWEHLFLFSKSKKYYFDLDAIRKPLKPESILPKNAGFSKVVSFNYRVREATKVPLVAKFGNMYSATHKEIEKYGSPRAREYRAKCENYKSMHNRSAEERANGTPHDLANCNPKGGNPGDMWDITTQPHPFAHFACYPERLCERPIKAGCPEFVCNKCGKARIKIMKPSEEYAKLLNQSWTEDTDKDKQLRNQIGFQANTKKVACTAEYLVNGYTDCGCNAGFNSGIVLDPFLGSGTTALVALKLGRKFIGIEQNSDYIKIAEERLKPFLEQSKLNTFHDRSL